MNEPPDPRRHRGDAVVELPVTKSIDTQAAEWLAILDAESPSEKDILAFKRWVGEDPAHSEAFESMIEFWDELNVLTQATLPRELAGQNRAARSAGAGNRFRVAFIGVASGVVALIVTAILLIVPGVHSPEPVVYSTSVGEQKTIELADSSTVLLNTDSRLEVLYSESHRRLRLTQGEAHFEVFHDTTRPFEVSAGKGLVRALGTAFTVRINKVEVEVTVTEGVVEIDETESPVSTVTVRDSASPPSGNSAEETGTPFSVGIQVTAGNKLVYDREVLDRVKLLVASEIEKDLSWHQGMLVFSGEPLEKVVEEVSRYTELEIIIPERKAREMLVGGLFKVGDTDSLFEALREGFDIHLEVESDEVVYLISGEGR